MIKKTDLSAQERRDIVLSMLRKEKPVRLLVAGIETPVCQTKAEFFANGP